MTRTNELIEEIIQGACASVPSDHWDKVVVTVLAITRMIQLTGRYEVDGASSTFDPEQSGVDITMKARELRTCCYESAPDGAWYTAIFVVDSTGKFDVKFEYDEKPNFKYMPSKDKFLADLDLFPRADKTVPEWFQELDAG